MESKYQKLVENLGGRLSSSATSEPIAEQQLDTIETQLGYSLPADYREFLKYHGNSIFSSALFPVVKEQDIEEESVFFFYGASNGEPTIADHYRDAQEFDRNIPVALYPGLSLIRNLEPSVEEIPWPPELIPLACDMGGNQICLAAFGLHPEAVFFWVNAPSSGYMNVYLAANSFDEFMHSLRINPLATT